MGSILSEMDEVPGVNTHSFPPFDRLYLVIYCHQNFLLVSALIGNVWQDKLRQLQISPSLTSVKAAMINHTMLGISAPATPLVTSQSIHLVSASLYCGSGLTGPNTLGVRRQTTNSDRARVQNSTSSLKLQSPGEQLPWSQPAPPLALQQPAPQFVISWQVAQRHPPVLP